MTTRRMDTLLAIARERTKNKDYTYNAVTGATTSGISDTLFLEFFNQAQEHLQSAILAHFPNEFVDQEVISIVGNQEEYTIPDNLFANNKIISVEYNRNNNTQDYEPLPMGTIRDRDTRKGFPAFYIRRSGKILINPIPTSSQGYIRVSFYRTLDSLDIRRGTILSKTGTTSITAITLTTGTKDNYPYALQQAEYISINDADGTPECYAIPIGSYTAATGVIVPRGGTFALPSGSTITAGNFVTIGKYSTTHSKLNTLCERYLLTYAQKRIMTTDESQTAMEEDLELKQIEEDILSSYALETRDPLNWPIADYDLSY